MPNHNAAIGHCSWCNGYRETLPMGMCALHAAAPDLLAACKAAAGWFDRGDGIPSGPIGELIRAAIRKAEGGAA